MDSSKYHLFVNYSQKKHLLQYHMSRYDIGDRCALLFASSNHAVGLLVPDMTLQIQGDVE